MKKMRFGPLVIVLLLCYSSCLPPPPVNMDDLNSLRTHLIYHKTRTLALSPTETIVVTTQDSPPTSTAVISCAKLLSEYCNAQGGKLVAGRGLSKVYFDDYIRRRGSMQFLIRHFGIGTTYRCEGGNDPFVVKAAGGPRHYWRDRTVTTYVFLYIKATRPDRLLSYRCDLKREKYKAYTTVKEFIQGSFTGGTWVTKGRWEKKFHTELYNFFDFEAIMPFVWKAAAFCMAHGGNLHKIEGGKDYPFKEWLLKFLFERKGSPLQISGFYYCKDSDTPFMAKVTKKGVTAGQVFRTNTLFVVHHVIVKPGIDPKYFPAGVIRPLPSIPEGKYSINIKTAGTFPSMPEDIVALSTAIDKIDTVKKISGKVYKGIYNGSEGNCDLVSVIEYVPTFENIADTLNYKICNGEIIQREPTTLNDLVTEEVEKLIPQAAKMAQRYGSAVIQASSGYIIRAKAIRDERECNVEVKVMHGIKLVDSRVVDACALK